MTPAVTETGTGEQMGFMKLSGSIHITPELRRGLRPIVPCCSSPSPSACLGPGSAQCEYTIGAVVPGSAQCEYTIRAVVLGPACEYAIVTCKYQIAHFILKVIRYNKINTYLIL